MDKRHSAHLRNKVERLEHTIREVAQELWALFQRAYAREAELLGIVNFPPLKRTAGSIRQSHGTFFGLSENGVLVAAAEVQSDDRILSIDSFVVDPQAFRQGYGSRLLQSLLEDSGYDRAEVETSTQNEPALRLYRKFGFREVARRETADGIEIIKLGAELRADEATQSNQPRPDC